MTLNLSKRQQCLDPARRYLPPYSLDLHPIEQMLAKLKALLRKAAARTPDTLWQTIVQLLDAISEPSAATISVTQDALLSNPKLL